MIKKISITFFFIIILFVAFLIYLSIYGIETTKFNSLIKNEIKSYNNKLDIKLKSVNKILGKNTLEAVRSGFYWGYSGLIENIIRKITKKTNKKFKIILTGGLSHLFKKTIPFKISINKNLTIDGLLKVVQLIN